MIWLGLVCCGMVGFGMAQWGEHWFATRYFLPSKNLWALPVVSFSGAHLPAAIGSSALVLFYLFKFLPLLKVPPAASLRGGHPWNCNCCRTHEHFFPPPLTMKNVPSYHDQPLVPPLPLIMWSSCQSEEEEILIFHSWLVDSIAEEENSQFWL